MTEARHARVTPRKPWTIAAVVMSVPALIFAVAMFASPSSAATVSLNGFNCTKVDKANGGFTLDCEPGGTPSSTTPGGSASPSATTSATSSPSTHSPSPTVSPSSSTPSPTGTSTSSSPPPPGPQLNCWNRLKACGYPDESTTGALDNVARTASPSLNIRTGGTFQNLNVEGCITILTSSPVTLRNIVVHGNSCNGNIAKHGAGSLLIEDVTSYCDNGRGHGFWVANTIARRVDTYGCENGFELNENSTVENSRIAAKEANSDGHGDGIQSQGGTNVHVRHNTILMTNPVTSAIITNPTQNAGWVIEDNFMGGGAFTLYCPENGRAGWIVQNNRFIRAKTSNPYSAAYGLTDACGAPIQWINNKYDDTGLPVSSSS